jgi:hypothetical protein
VRKRGPVLWKKVENQTALAFAVAGVLGTKSEHHNGLATSLILARCG